jgi:arylsulfatase A-like enzyme
VFLTRRHFLLSGATTAFAQKKRRPVTRPNILLIVADDLASWMLGCYGNKEIRTPNIDLLARSGTRFVNNFVCTPICSASRATLFTGRVPRQHGIHDFLTARPIDDPPQGQLATPPSFGNELMISDILAGQGYNCGYVGKWHMGDDQKPQHGFRFWYTMRGGSSPYQNPRMSWNGEIIEEQGYLADLMTRRAVQFLEQQKPDQPFFLVASYFNPHTPYEGHPQKYYDMYAKTAFETVGWEPPAANALREKNYLKDIVGNLRKAAASVTALDDQIPALTSVLDQKGMRDNTLIVFTGDNGYLLGRHGLWSKGLASDPINMYEEVMQTPMIWNWPGKVPVEGARPELVSFYDVLPSLCEVARVATPTDRTLCGRSYVAMATNKPLPKKEPWENLVFGHFRNTEMARDFRYKLVVRDGGESPGGLYDVRADPRERVNHYDNPEFATVRNRLGSALEAWRKKYS